MQNLIVLAIVAIAAYAVLRQVLASRKKGCGCSGGCPGEGGCSTGKGSAQGCAHVSPDPRDSSLKTIR